MPRNMLYDIKVGHGHHPTLMLNRATFQLHTTTRWYTRHCCDRSTSRSLTALQHNGVSGLHSLQFARYLFSYILPRDFVGSASHPTHCSVDKIWYGSTTDPIARAYDSALRQGNHRKSNRGWCIGVSCCFDLELPVQCHNLKIWIYIWTNMLIYRPRTLVADLSFRSTFSVFFIFRKFTFWPCGRQIFPPFLIRNSPDWSVCQAKNGQFVQSIEGTRRRSGLRKGKISRFRWNIETSSHKKQSLTQFKDSARRKRKFPQIYSETLHTHTSLHLCPSGSVAKPCLLLWILVVSVKSEM